MTRCFNYILMSNVHVHKLISLWKWREVTLLTCLYKTDIHSYRGKKYLCSVNIGRAGNKMEQDWLEKARWRLCLWHPVAHSTRHISPKESWCATIQIGMCNKFIRRDLYNNLYWGEQLGETSVIVSTNRYAGREDPITPGSKEMEMKRWISEILEAKEQWGGRIAIIEKMHSGTAGKNQHWSSMATPEW